MDSADLVSAPRLARPLRLEPFQALMLGPSRVADPASARAFARPYRAVARRLSAWEERGQVLRDHEGPAVHLHEYTAGGLTVRGYVGALDLTRPAGAGEPTAVWPHERIHAAQAGELAQRMGEMQLNPAPILLAHRGGPALRELSEAVCAAPPTRSFTDRAGHRHRLWALRDDQALQRLATLVSGSEALLADGHHRYAAYLELQRARPGTAWDSGLAMLVDQDDTPLFLGAIHRVLPSVDFDHVHAAATEAGLDPHLCDRPAAMDHLGRRAPVLTDGERWACLHLPARRLAVEVVDRELLPCTRQGGQEVTVRHRHSLEDALAAGTAPGSAVLLPAPRFDEVRDVIAAGGLLPEKATSFQPKPAVGVLMRSLRDG